MNRTLLLIVTCVLLSPLSCLAEESFPVWSGLAPGEKGDMPAPKFTVYQPEQKTSDACVIICPGGGYNMLVLSYEGEKIVNFFRSKGITTVLLEYRVPRRKGIEKHLAAWQDAQRTIKHVRANAEKWGINPEKIGMIGFSAGGHLTVLCDVNSQTPAYEFIDELDKTPCHLNFAIPVYPAYVLEDGASEPNKNKGIDSPMVKDFKFDDKCAPMCLFHGDNDRYSSLGSIAIYSQMKKKGIPMELHIYAQTPHGFVKDANDNHAGDWLNRVYEWMKIMGL